MKVVYLGTGAAEGVPALFCNCSYCVAARRQGGALIRSRAQVLLDGELSVDFPPDAFYHAVRFGADLSSVKYLLVTHSHMDHFNPADLVLRGYKYAHNMAAPDLDIFGNEEVGEVFREGTRRELKPVVGEHLRFHAVKTFECFSCGDWRVHALRAQHSSRDPLLYLIEKGGKKVLHLCDTGTLPPDSAEYLASAAKAVGLVTMDCTFLFGKTEPAARHMGLDENEKVRETLLKSGVADANTKFVITHFSHNGAPSRENLERAEREYGVIAAYDGMTVDL